MKREYSLKGRKLFYQVYKEGKRYSKNNIQLYVLGIQGSESHNTIHKNIKLGIAINKRFGKAFLRNRVKRRFKAIVNELIQETNNGFMIILKTGIGYRIQDFEFEKRVIRSLLYKAGIINRNEYN